MWERGSSTQRQIWRRKLLDIDTFARDVYMILPKAKGAFLMAGNADMRMMYCFAICYTNCESPGPALPVMRWRWRHFALRGVLSGHHYRRRVGESVYFKNNERRVNVIYICKRGVWINRVSIGRWEMYILSESKVTYMDGSFMISVVRAAIVGIEYRYLKNVYIHITSVTFLQRKKKKKKDRHAHSYIQDVLKEDPSRPSREKKTLVNPRTPTLKPYTKARSVHIRQRRWRLRKDKKRQALVAESLQSPSRDQSRGSKQQP